MAAMFDAIPPEGATRRVRAALMHKVCGDQEMFALGGSIAGLGFMIELEALGGRAQLAGHRVESLLSYPAG